MIPAQAAVVRHLGLGAPAPAHAFDLGERVRVRVRGEASRGGRVCRVRPGGRYDADRPSVIRARRPWF